MVLVVVFLTLFNPVEVFAECDSGDTGDARGVERINERFDDFFRYRESLEERERARDKGRGENRGALAERAKRLEEARQEYVKNRRPRPDASALEEENIIEQKKRMARLESARRCLVGRRDQAESMLRRGRSIPGNAEYDLDN